MITKNKIALALFALFLGTACAGKKEGEEMKYKQITQEEAYEIMQDKSVDALILDVRTDEEFEQGHIPGAICVPVETIGDSAPKQLPDKERTILVYCRSGARSKRAALKLAELGYSDIREFGGIMSWPYEVTKE